MTEPLPNPSALQVYGLVGHPLGHSFSRKFFRSKFQREGITADYLNFDLEDISVLRRLIEANPSICGFNVTIPYKQAVIPLMDALDDNARRVGAVNVISIKRPGGKLILMGHNTDTVGFGAMLDEFSLRPDDKALILGTGGASLAVMQALRSRGLSFTRVSRHPAMEELSYDNLTEEVIKGHRIVINATPLGTFPHTDACAPIPYQLLTGRHIAIDLVYNPSVTLFMQKAAASGAAVKNGLQMLHAQAIAAWNIWTGQSQTGAR